MGEGVDGLDTYGSAAGVYLCRASGNVHHGHCDDESGYFKPGDDASIEYPTESAYQYACNDRRGDGPAAVYYKPDGGDSRESDYRTDTQVYATDDDDKSHAQAEADIAEHLTTDGQDVVLCQKNRREQGQSGHHYHKDGEDAQIRL